jgi:DNA-binding MarR family transcriptional regulator
MSSVAASTRRRAPAAGEGKRGVEGHVGYLLRQAHGVVRSALDAELARIGLTSAQFLLLNLLDAYPGASGADLARIAMLTPQTVNLVVRKLQRDGLVQQSRHAAHGRILQLSLSADGKARLRDCKRRADRIEQQLLVLLNPESEAMVREWLVAIARSLAR